MKASLIASLLVVAACGDGNKGPPDAAPRPDAPPDAAACTAPSSFTAVSNLALSYKQDRDDITAGDQEEWKAIGEIDAAALRDLLWIELFEGPSPQYTTLDFPATPFTIQLTGAELDYLTCSTCITITTDVDVSMLDPGSVDYVDAYMARSGSVTITTLTSTEISGTLADIELAHVDISNTGTAVNPSGCTTTLASLAFTATVQPTAAGRAGFRIPVGKTGKRALRRN